MRNSIGSGGGSLARVSVKLLLGRSALFRLFFGGEQGSNSNCPSGKSAQSLRPKMSSALEGRVSAGRSIDRHPREDDCCQRREGSLAFPASRLGPTATWPWQPVSWVGVTLCALRKHCLSLSRHVYFAEARGLAPQGRPLRCRDKWRRGRWRRVRVQRAAVCEIGGRLVSADVDDGTLVFCVDAMK